ncbi:MAG: hypothetical protein COA53_12325 [Rhodobacteraceae bacterium]|nr:MAG: hypothetical protein COA53_12325 [Paracoccaceae bacterium]
MINRRQFSVTGVAAALYSAATPALAHERGEPYILPEEFMPRVVRLKTEIPAGEIHINPNNFTLYWTLENNRAIRYTPGVGRENLYHPGTFYVGAKQEWPKWKPTNDMIERSPESYGQFAEGMPFENGQPGGISNPLGARALYLYTESGRDTYLRIHGTNDPRTIGRAVSNGCARLVNDQVAELYELVPIGTKVVLYEKIGAGPAHKDIS